MILYQLETCPYCKMVRDKLDELKLNYEKINVPAPRDERKEVFEISGQYFVPVLKDDNTILDDEEKIIKYLDEKYAKKGSPE
ncbi:MAG: glutaredoxin family protein [Nitrospirota bacterium]